MPFYMTGQRRVAGIGAILNKQVAVILSFIAFKALIF